MSVYATAKNAKMERCKKNAKGKDWTHAHGERLI